MSTVFRDGPGVVELCIGAPLKGRWCSLITARAALSICATESGQRDVAQDTPDDAVDDDIRLVKLR